MNIEVMLAPNRTYLLMNKHKTFNAKSSKEKENVDKQRDSSNHSYVSEKRLVDRRYQEFYIKRVHMFLKQLSPDMRTAVLDRKSFSPSLTKLQDEYDQMVIASNKFSSNKVMSTKQLMLEEEPPTSVRRPSFPVIPTEKQVSQSSVGFHERANDREVAEKRSKPYKHSTIEENTLSEIQGSRIRKDDESNALTNSRSTGYFPPVAPTHKITRDVMATILCKTRDNAQPMPPLAKQKNVKFETSKDANGYKLWHDSQIKERHKILYLDQKVEEFMLDQIKFNQTSMVSHYDSHKRLTEKVDKSINDSNCNLVDIFDRVCQTGNKQQMHKLMKMAAKMKVQKPNPAVSTSIVPSVATFKKSQTFKRLNMNNQQVLVRN